MFAIAASSSWRASLSACAVGVMDSIAPSVTATAAAARRCNGAGRLGITPSRQGHRVPNDSHSNHTVNLRNSEITVSYHSN